MKQRQTGWLSTEEAAAQVGMGSDWIRDQIHAGRLAATVFRTGKRPTYRIKRSDWRAFLRRYVRSTDDPDWE